MADWAMPDRQSAMTMPICALCKRFQPPKDGALQLDTSEENGPGDKDDDPCDNAADVLNRVLRNTRKPKGSCQPRKPQKR